MGNIRELSINVVKKKKPKSLIGFAKRQVAGTGSQGYPVMDKESHRRIERHQQPDGPNTRLTDLTHSVT
jgi:hypothetical protein